MHKDMKVLFTKAIIIYSYERFIDINECRNAIIIKYTHFLMPYILIKWIN